MIDLMLHDVCRQALEFFGDRLQATEDCRYLILDGDHEETLGIDDSPERKAHASLFKSRRLAFFDDLGIYYAPVAKVLF